MPYPLVGAYTHVLRFEKWQAEKMKRKEQNLPAIVDYRDETYVGVASSGTKLGAC